jgi:regulator of replication initiation timing
MGTAIVLIIVGIAIIIISCFMVDKTDKKSKDFVLNTGLDEKVMDISGLKQQVEEMCQETTEGYLYKTENQLSQLSNEKIIAVNDFSEQILEKIKLNHEEVVFLYNMLGEKEEELKTLMRNADKQKKVIEEASVRSETAKDTNVSKSKKNVSQVKVEQKQTLIPEDSEASSNSNQKILELYSQGFSIVDISKALEIGQGEVKLVVDLYKENAKQQ